MKYFDFPLKEAEPPKATFEPIQDAPTDLPLTAQQWTRAAGCRWEHVSGFLHLQTKQHGREKRRSHNDWQAHWDAYLNRPVK